MRKILSVIAFTLLFALRPSAQNSYPIYVSPSLTPPYSLKLSDYSKFGSQGLVVNIAVNDLGISNLPVKLHIKLETVGVTIENIPNLNTTPIYLDGGAASMLFGDDLKDYFDINNLVFKGYSKDAYRKTGQLPEGFYKVSVEVHHYQTNRLISNVGTASAWIAIGKPPLLKLPENGKELGEFKGMPLVFSWYPVNLGSPISAGSVQYKFELWELRVEGVSPYTVAATVPVFYEETTPNTMLSVLPASLLMTPGARYAWRVTASDLSGLVPFEGDGHSEIRVFTYRSKCDAPKDLKSKAKGTEGLFVWTPAKNHTSYNVELRKPETGWLSASETFENKAEFFDLDYGTKYELRVQAVCDNDPDTKSDFTGWVRLETPKKMTPPDSATCPNCGCGTPNGTGNIENLTLKKDLKPGDTLTNRYGTTRYILKSVEPTGDGKYKGLFYFWAEIWKLKFICEYWDLSANTDGVILSMDFQSVYNPQFLLDVDATTDYLNGLADALAVLTSNARISDTLRVNENVLSYYVNDAGELIAVTAGPNGEYREVVVKEDVDDVEETLIKGANGEECVVTKNGEVMGAKEYRRTGGGNGRLIEKYIAENERNNLSNDVQVDFTASPGQRYGFDAFTPEKETIKAKYPALGNGYIPAFKSVASFTMDKVVPSSAGNGISFRDQMGVSAIRSGDDLTIRGGADGTVTALYAYKAINDTTEKIAGKLNLMSFDEQAKKLYIVPVNNANTPDVTELQNVLNRIYAQAVTRWEVVKIGKSVDVPFANGQMTHGGSSAISVYNDDQQAIISKFKEGDSFEKDALYLFFVDNVKGKTGDVAGFMPLQRQAGFIYDSPNLFVIAHELAHGTFNLRHTFSPEELIAAENTTQNLMDYKGGSDLWKHQWELIRDPESMLFAWAQDEKEGEMTITPKKGLVVGYVISDPESYIRQITSPFQIKEPKQKLEKGKEVTLVNTLVEKKFITVKYLDDKEEYVTSFANVTQILKLDNEERYQLLKDEESLKLPYSDVKTGSISKKDTCVLVDKVCGDYYQVKEKTTTNEGWWVLKKSLKRISNDVTDNFNWMEDVSLGTDAVPKEVLDVIIKNKGGLNDRTDKNVYPNNIKKIGEKGYFYSRNDNEVPEPDGNDFEKKVMKLLLEELKKEGSFSSINTYDDEHFSWGKGLAVTGPHLMNVIDKLFKIEGKNYEQIFLNVGIKVVNKHFWVVDSEGKWKKDSPPVYEASDYIKKNTQLLSFFVELAEKSSTYKDVMQVQYEVIGGLGALKYPSYIMNSEDNPTGYSDNWSDISVTVLCHLSHWAGYGWHEGKDRYKDTKGDLDKILYKYLYNTVVNYPTTRKEPTLATKIYQWRLDGQNPLLVLDRLSEFGIPVGSGNAKLEEIWNAHTIEIEFKKDKEGILRAVVKDAKKYVTNTECIMFYKGDKYLIITKNAETINYGEFKE